ncbi:hypothetical protein CLM_1758 [Clostridium botulinum A2 str. Kyoto]|nr:hypothetical protein CLM_1758 [Clostridium botulinum A2 str. Kyoto]
MLSFAPKYIFDYFLFLALFLHFIVL